MPPSSLEEIRQQLVILRKNCLMAVMAQLKSFHDVKKNKTKIHESIGCQHVLAIVLSQIGLEEVSSTTNRWQKSALED